MKCKECGYELPKNGSECRVCQNRRRWEERVKEKVIKSTFTKRIAKELPSLNIAPGEKDIKKLQEGKGVYVFGPTGSGKTLYACAVALEMRRRSYIFPDSPGCYQVKFINSLNLLEEIRSSFSSHNKENRTTEEILEYYSYVDLLVLDDLGAERPTDWSLSILSIIINNRYEALLPTIVTSNLDLPELSEQLDDRIASRLYEMCRSVEFDNKDHRIGKG